MADVTGRISTLPGSRHTVPEGSMCDRHPERVAVVRIQGETDSFGSEMHDLCQECIDEIREHAEQDRKGQCDWCKQDKTDLRPKRDYDEGLYGPVYRVCGDCAGSYDRSFAEEAEAEMEW